MEVVEGFTHAHSQLEVTHSYIHVHLRLVVVEVWKDLLAGLVLGFARMWMVWRGLLVGLVAGVYSYVHSQLEVVNSYLHSQLEVVELFMVRRCNHSWKVSEGFTCRRICNG